MTQTHSSNIIKTQQYLHYSIFNFIINRVTIFYVVQQLVSKERTELHTEQFTMLVRKQMKSPQPLDGSIDSAAAGEALDPRSATSDI